MIASRYLVAHAVFIELSTSTGTGSGIGTGTTTIHPVTGWYQYQYNQS